MAQITQSKLPKLFVINFIIGICYSLLFYVFINKFHLAYLTSSITLNIIGSLQGCLWYYLGEKSQTRDPSEETKEELESSIRMKQYNNLTTTRGE